ARPKAGSSRPARIAMMAITTSSSMRVNARAQTNGLSGLFSLFMAGQQHTRKVVELQRRTKHQIPNCKLQRNPGIEKPKTKIQTPKKSQVPNSKPRPELRAWNLELGASLVLGVWCLEL